MFKQTLRISRTAFTATYGPNNLKVFVKRIEPSLLSLDEEAIEQESKLSVAVQIH